MRNNKRKSHLHKCIIIVIACLLLLTGCWDRREIEERTNVVSVGIDPAEKKGQLLVSMQIPIPRLIAGGQGGGGGGGQPVKVISASGGTFLSSVTNMQHKVNQKMFYGHTRILAINEKVARRGLTDIIDALRREPQVRQLLWPIIVKKNKAVELLKVKTELKQIPAVFLMSMVENGIDLGALPDLPLGQFYITLSKKAAEPMMYVAEISGTEDVTITGVAVFREGKLVGYLNMEETSILLHITEENDGSRITVTILESPKIAATFNPDLENTKYKYSYKNGKIHINIDVTLEGEVNELTKEKGYELRNQKKKIEKSIEKNLEKKASALISKLQNEYRSDVLGLGTRLRSFHYDLWQKVNWETAFTEAVINVDYQVHIRSSGMEKTM